MYQTVWEHISIIVLFFLSLLAVFSFNQSQTETAVQAASLPVWIDYDIHERDVIQVKLFDDLPIRAQNGRLTLANTRQPDRVAIAVALNELPDGRWQPIFDQPEAKLSQWRQHGVARTGQPLPDLNLYFQVRLPDGVEATDALAQFRASPLVQGAYGRQWPLHLG